MKKVGNPLRQSTWIDHTKPEIYPEKTEQQLQNNNNIGPNTKLETEQSPYTYPMQQPTNTHKIYNSEVMGSHRLTKIDSHAPIEESDSA